MTAALAAISVIEEDQIGENCEKIGNKITEGLKEMQEDYEVMGDIRGPGLFIGVEMVKDRETKEPFTELVEEMVLLAPEYNLYLGESMPILSARGEMLMRNLVKIKPPLIITEDDAEFILKNFEKVLQEALKEVEK
jgi:4-aminobutyrate aminotransferase-like enzyme